MSYLFRKYYQKWSYHCGYLDHGTIHWGTHCGYKTERTVTILYNICSSKCMQAHRMIIQRRAYKKKRKKKRKSNPL